MHHLTLMIKPASSLCNMRCRYCFYEDEANNRICKSLGRMDGDTARALIQRAMDYIGENGSLSLVFQGGEPTLAGAEWFQRFAETAEQLRPRGAVIHYAIQTNAYEISDALLAVLRRYHFLAGVSLDGYRALHDSHRVDAAGAGTWQRVLGNVKRMQSTGIATNALCVITAQAAGNAQKIYRTLKQLGFRYQQYIPCLDPLGAQRGQASYSLTPEAYGQFLEDAFVLWYDGWRRGDYVSVRTFEDFVSNAMGVPCTSCAASGQCGQYLVIEADGSAYPCDFYALDAWRLGNICQDDVGSLLGGEAAKRFLSQRAAPPQECGGCPYRTLCRTGCPRDWERGEDGNRNYYCRAYQTLLRGAMPRILEIAASQRGK